MFCSVFTSTEEKSMKKEAKKKNKENKHVAKLCFHFVCLDVCSRVSVCPREIKLKIRTKYDLFLHGESVWCAISSEKSPGMINFLFWKWFVNAIKSCEAQTQTRWLFNTLFQKNLDGKTLSEYFRQFGILRLRWNTEKERATERLSSRLWTNERRTCRNVYKHLFLNNHNLILSFSVFLIGSIDLLRISPKYKKLRSNILYWLQFFFCVIFLVVVTFCVGNRTLVDSSHFPFLTVRFSYSFSSYIYIKRTPFER